MQEFTFDEYNCQAVSAFAVPAEPLSPKGEKGFPKQHKL